MLMAVAAGLTLVSTVLVDAREVTVGDLVRGEGAKRLGETIAARVALRLPAGQRSVALGGPAVAALVRRHATGFTVAEFGTVTVTLRAHAPIARTCWASNRALASGATVTIRDVEAVICGGAAASVVTQAGVPVIRDAVPAGAVLGRFVPARADRVAAGTELTLRSIAGPVTIERGVTTLQPGRSGRRVFVRDGLGHVFAAPLVLSEGLQ